MVFAKGQSREYYERAFLIEQLRELGHNDNVEMKTNRELRRMIAVLRIKKENLEAFRQIKAESPHNTWF